MHRCVILSIVAYWGFIFHPLAFLNSSHVECLLNLHLYDSILDNFFLTAVPFNKNLFICELSCNRLLKRFGRTCDKF